MLISYHSASEAGDKNEGLGGWSCSSSTPASGCRCRGWSLFHNDNTLTNKIKSCFPSTSWYGKKIRFVYL